MTKAMDRLAKFLLVGIATLALAIIAAKGCEYFPESTFRLARESRLPKWTTLPPGISRAGVLLTIKYYTLPYASFLLENTEKRPLEKTYGHVHCAHPLELKIPPEGFPQGYPTYEVVTVNGITEIFEQRKPEDILYLTDYDSPIWHQYRASGCS